MQASRLWTCARIMSLEHSQEGSLARAPICLRCTVVRAEGIMIKGEHFANIAETSRTGREELG